MRLGIYIGSFNPVHKGHIDVVNYLIKNDYVDKILIVPTLGYWDKQDLVDIKHRINMLKIFENDQIMVDTEHNTYKYTYQLMQALSEDYSDELYLIIGADNIIDFNKWKNYKALLNYKIVVMNRDNIDIDSYIQKYYSNNFIIAKGYKYINISSSEIRKNLSSKYLDKKVLKYIKDNHLYC